MTQPAERYHLLFGVRRSVRYHSYRHQFYIGAQSTIHFVIIVLGSGSLLNLLDDQHATGLSVWGAFIITLLASLSLVFGLSSKAALHNDLYRRFANLEREFTAVGPEDEKALARLLDRRLEIEMDEPATYKALNRLCHNELVRSEDRSEYALKLQLHQRVFRHFLRFDNLSEASSKSEDSVRNKQPLKRMRSEDVCGKQ